MIVRKISRRGFLKLLGAAVIAANMRPPESVAGGTMLAWVKTAPGKSWDGQMTHLAIFNRTLSHSEILTLANDRESYKHDDSCIGFWPMQDAPGPGEWRLHYHIFEE